MKKRILWITLLALLIMLPIRSAKADGEPLLIDVGDAAVGNPLFDVAQMYLNYVMLPQAIRAGRRPETLLGYSVELAEPLWRGQLKGYFGTEDDAELDRIQASLMPLVRIHACYGGAQAQGNSEEDLRMRADMLVRRAILPALEATPTLAL